MFEKQSTACFTGHREHHIPVKTDNEDMKRLVRSIEMTVTFLYEKCGITSFISGMATGIDTYAAMTVVKLRDAGLNVKLVCAIPCHEQENRWVEAQQQQYSDIIASADDVVYVGEDYSLGCMQERNEYMVNASSIMISIWDGNDGGTANTNHYAKGTDISVINISPKTSLGDILNQI